MRCLASFSNVRHSVRRLAEEYELQAAGSATTAIDASPSLASDGGQNRSSHIFMPQMQVQYLKLFRDVLLNQHYNNHPHLVDGGLWPPGSAAMSMAGQRRMDNMVELLSVAYADK
eukprot:1240575-Pleurochrysis_carterae.AAC.1